MSKTEKPSKSWGLSLGKGLSFDDEKPPLSEKWGLSLGKGLRFDTTPETDTDLHPTEQDCPRAYRRSFKP